MLTAVVGMLLAVPYLPNLLLIIVASTGIALSAMSAAVFNHIVDEKIDIKMSRTSRRPLPQGKVSRNQALIWGLFLGFIGMGLLLVYVNLLTAVLTFSSLIGYAVFYTMYFKTCNAPEYSYWRSCWSCSSSFGVDFSCRSAGH